MYHSLTVICFAFLCGFVMDLVWAMCVDAIQMRCPLTAANMSAVLYLCTVVSTVLIVAQCVVAIVAYMAGGWLGTHVVVWHRARKQ